MPKLLKHYVLTIEYELEEDEETLPYFEDEFEDMSKEEILKYMVENLDLDDFANYNVTENLSQIQMGLGVSYASIKPKEVPSEEEKT